MDARVQPAAINQLETTSAVYEIIQYDHLAGSADVRTAESLFFVSSAGMRLKLVKVRLTEGRLRVEPGALYYMHGQLSMKATTGGGIVKGLSRKFLSGETFLVNEIEGTGEVYLEPSFGHFYLHNINGQGIIVDKGMYYAGCGDLNISAKMQSKLTGGALGGEGWFQTHIRGTGVAVLYSPVPMHEVQRVDLRDEVLQVDGNFALMRTDGVSFSVKKSSKSWISTSVSGEGLLQTFSGTGTVWLAPTQSVYERMATPGGLQALSLPPGSMGHTVGKK